MNIEETKLSNNLRVITNKMPNFQSAAVGAFVHAGSRNETIENNGVAHMLEHMAFKSTNKRTAYQISQEIEVLGSYVNAMTGTESTAYYAKGLSENIATATDIIGDALTDSVYNQDDINLESGVIIQEICRYEDNPSSVMNDILQSLAYPDQPVGRKILGTRDFVSNATSDVFRNFVNEQYSAETMIVFASGGLDHNEVVDAANNAFHKIPATTNRPQTLPVTYVGGLGIDTSKPFTQVAAGICFKSVPVIFHSMYAHMLLAEAFGGGMSSPLFTEVREKRGLVYSTGCNGDFNPDYGDVSIYGGTTPENLAEFINVACSEFAKMRETINEVDLTRAKNTVLVRIALMQEKPEAMMSYMANSMFTRNRIREFDEIKRDIEKINIDDLKSAAKFLFESKPTISLVGPVPDADYEGMVKAAIG
jgi:predicted Zn-dependent peptidase